MPGERTRGRPEARTTAREVPRSTGEGRKPTVEAVERLHRMLAMLLEAPRSRDELAGVLQRDPSSVSRDIAVLRKLGVGIRENRRLPYTLNRMSMPLFLTVAEARVLRIAWERALQQGLPDDEVRCLRQMLARVPAGVLARAAASGDGNGKAGAYEAIVDALRAAINDACRVRVRWHAPGLRQPAEQVLDACELHWVDGALVLIAAVPTDDERGHRLTEIRVDQILEAEPSQEAWLLPELPKFAFVYKLAPELAVRFRPPRGHEKISEDGEGAIARGRELDLARALRYLLGLGPHVEALDPPELRLALADVLDQLRALYRSEPGPASDPG